MRTWKKVALICVLSVVSLLIGWVCYVVREVHAQYPAEWATQDDGLRIHYFRLKQQIHLQINENYRPGAPRVWRRLPGDPGVRPDRGPEELLPEAMIPAGRSDPVGMVRFYSEATALQRYQIEGDLEEACVDPASEVCDSILRTIVDAVVPELRELHDEVLRRRASTSSATTPVGRE